MAGFSFENFEARLEAASMSGGVQQGTDRLNGVAALANDSWNVALARGQMKDHLFRRFGLRKDNLVWKFNELADDEAKELLHASEPAQAVAFFRAFVIMLPTVCEGRAPTLTQ
jgi:hypothetical protein